MKRWNWKIANTKGSKKMNVSQAIEAIRKVEDAKKEREAAEASESVR